MTAWLPSNVSCHTIWVSVTYIPVMKCPHRPLTTSSQAVRSRAGALQISPSLLLLGKRMWKSRPLWSANEVISFLRSLAGILTLALPKSYSLGLRWDGLRAQYFDVEIWYPFSAAIRIKLSFHASNLQYHCFQPIENRISHSKLSCVWANLRNPSKVFFRYLSK